MITTTIIREFETVFGLQLRIAALDGVDHFAVHLFCPRRDRVAGEMLFDDLRGAEREFNRRLRRTSHRCNS